MNGASLRAGRLLPPVPEGTVASFLDRSSKDQSIIQCNILALSEIGGTEYGVGYPVDMPVMLTYFEGSELKPVRSDYPDYDHLVNHVAVQLEGNDLHLFRTPIVLTLQGEFEDEDFNEVNPFQRSGPGSPGAADYSSDTEEGYDSDVEEDTEYDESAQEITLEELLRSEDFDDDESAESDHFDGSPGSHGWGDEDDTEDGADSEEGDNKAKPSEFHAAADRADPLLDFLNAPSSKTAVQRKARPNTPGDHIPTPHTVQQSDFKLLRPEHPDLTDIPEDALVTAEDTAGLQRAHRRADRIIEYAADMRLMGSFHHKKRNFHLVRLLEPIFVMGRRIADIKGHFFALLDERETEQVRPVLEELLLRGQQASSSGASSTSSLAGSSSGDTARQPYDRPSVGSGRDRANKRFDSNRRSSRPTADNQRTIAYTDIAGKAKPIRDMGVAEASSAHPAVAKKRGSDAGESQYQSAKRKWQRVRNQQP